MAYIGNTPAEAFSSFQKQDFTTSATTSYTLDHPVANQNELALFINFVRQEPTTAYTASGTSLTLTSATSSSDDMYCVYLGKAIQTVNPPSGSVGSSQVAASIITGQTALASEPADTDEFLVSDAGTLKRIDYSLIKGGGITEIDQWRVNTTFTGNASPIASNWERVDVSDRLQGYLGTGMSESSGVFTFPSTGFYLVIFQSKHAVNGDDRSITSAIRTTPDNSTFYDTASNSTFIQQTSSNFTAANIFVNAIVDVEDTSTDKVAFSMDTYNSSTQTQGETNQSLTAATFIRLADT
jgi:hypothetical protein